eukprot:1157112-Pelagomonas_calceolata.AAC.6
MSEALGGFEQLLSNRQAFLQISLPTRARQSAGMGAYEVDTGWCAYGTDAYEVDARWCAEDVPVNLYDTDSGPSLEPQQCPLLQPKAQTSSRGQSTSTATQTLQHPHTTSSTKASANVKRAIASCRPPCECTASQAQPNRVQFHSRSVNLVSHFSAVNPALQAHSATVRNSAN